jgi:hypothetical protein
MPNVQRMGALAGANPEIGVREPWLSAITLIIFVSSLLSAVGVDRSRASHIFLQAGRMLGSKQRDGSGFVNTVSHFCQIWHQSRGTAV